ncbi:MAG: OmpA family protein [Rhizobiales bacterium]|nr:OmpA family protein [Hyphomicrobiales bacterium]
MVYFGLNEKAVSGIGIQELAKVSAYADNLTTAAITVSGHTDRSGDALYNAHLAEARAQSVMNALKDSFGVAGHEIRLETHGADAPAIDDGRAYQPRNRRVEITVTPAGGAGQPQQAATPESADDQPMWKKRASI